MMHDPWGVFRMKLRLEQANYLTVLYMRHGLVDTVAGRLSSNTILSLSLPKGYSPEVALAKLQRVKMVS